MIIVIGILASIGLPAYQKVTERARVAEAKSMLSAIRSSQFRYFEQYQRYANGISALDIDTGTTTKYFTYTVFWSAFSPSLLGWANRTTLEKGTPTVYTIWLWENGTFTISAAYQYLL